MSTSPDDEVAAPEQSDAEAVRAAVTPPPQTVRRYATYDPTTKDLAVWENGVVIGHVNTYPQMGAL